MTPEKPIIMMVEDDPDCLKILCAYLETGGWDAWETHATISLQEATEWLQEHQPSLILLDLNLPDSMGIKTLEKMLCKVPGVPIIVITGLSHPGIEEEVMALGTLAFIRKDTIHRNVPGFLKLIRGYLFPMPYTA